MRIVFIGAVIFSEKMLKKLIILNAEIVGVCTKESSNFNSDFVDLSKICILNGIPYKHIDNINSKDCIKWIQSLKPDIIFCFGWSSLIKDELLNLPKMGIVGYHPAKLPKNRGRHPLIWALALGLSKSASTFFFMDSGADSGDILSQVEFDISFDDDAQSLYDKIINIAIWQIEDFLPKLINNNYQKIKQDESNSNYLRKRTKKDGVIDFRMNSIAIYNLVRALTKPYVGAHLVYKNEDVKVWKSEIISCADKNIEYGKIISSNNKAIEVKTNDGAIRILEHDFKKLPQVGEYL